MAISSRILENLEVVIGVGNKGATTLMVGALRKKVLQGKSVVDQLTRLYGRRGMNPSLVGSANYSEAEARLGSASGISNGWMMAKLTVALRQFGYVW